MSTTPLNITGNNTATQVGEIGKKKKTTASITSLVITGIVMLSAVFLLRAYIIKPFIVNGVSMYPTFNTWNYLLIDEATYNFIREPERGEVVVFQSPQDVSRFFIKRVVGLPGETVRLSGDTVTISINDGDNTVKEFTLSESYIIDMKRKGANLEMTLGDEEYFMLGDNRLESADSRYWGALRRDHIVGRAVLRLFPFNQISFMPGDHDYNN